MFKTIRYSKMKVSKKIKYNIYNKLSRYNNKIVMINNQSKNLKTQIMN